MKKDHFPRLLWCLCGLLACQDGGVQKGAGAPAQAKVPEVAPSSEHLEEPFLGACRSECERSRQMQAVAWQVVEEGCRAECEAAWERPLVVGGAQLDGLVDQEVRARGRLSDGKELVLEDGTRLGVEVSESATPWAGKSVMVQGTLRQGPFRIESTRVIILAEPATPGP